MRRKIMIRFAASVILAAVLSTSAFAASDAIQMLDTNKDGTVDMNEAKAAATALFDRLGGHQERCLALVEKWFKAADRNGDGKLDGQELNAAAGKRLLKLLRP
jgi:Ca2+-binding EF-hand superfamily protein